MSMEEKFNETKHENIERMLVEEDVDDIVSLVEKLQEEERKSPGSPIQLDKEGVTILTDSTVTIKERALVVQNVGMDFFTREFPDKIKAIVLHENPEKPNVVEVSGTTVTIPGNMVLPYIHEHREALSIAPIKKKEIGVGLQLRYCFQKEGKVVEALFYLYSSPFKKIYSILVDGNVKSIEVLRGDKEFSSYELDLEIPNPNKFLEEEDLVMISSKITKKGFSDRCTVMASAIKSLGELLQETIDPNYIRKILELNHYLTKKYM